MQVHRTTSQEAAPNGHQKVERAAPPAKNMEPYIRAEDGARMIAIEPHVYVNEVVWEKLGAFR